MRTKLHNPVGLEDGLAVYLVVAGIFEHMAANIRGVGMEVVAVYAREILRNKVAAWLEPTNYGN